MNKAKTLQHQLMIYFTSITLVIILILGISMLVATGLRLLESSQQETAAIEDALSQVDTQTNQEWQDTLRLYIAADDPRYFIRVALADGSAVYSSNAYSLYNQFDQLEQVFFLPDILWAEGTPHYFHQFNVQGTDVAILTDMEDNFEILQTLVQWIALISIVVLVLGVIIIRRLSKKISAPLIIMNREIQQLTPEDVGATLTEPEQPQEVHNLAKSFNQLLVSQQETLAREQQFITDASHELKTPLAAIRGHVNLIQRRGEQHPEVIPKSLAFVDKESKRMESLTQQLLLLGREKQTSDQVVVPLNDLLQQILEEFQGIAQQRVIIEADPQVTLLGNKSQFYQIFRNLIENAVKYTPVNGEIVIQLSKRSDHIVFSVSNTGTNIPDNEKAHIFERFYRVDQSRSSEIPGSGIGLAIVNQLVKLYNGEITVSDYQDGVCFRVKLPKNEENPH